MGAGVQRARLRTKTGCLTCRNRRKKCDEISPTCQRCANSGRYCQWPTSDDLLDRRYSSCRSRNSASPGPISVQTDSCDVVKVKHSSRGQSPTIRSKVCFQSESAAHLMIRHDLETVIARHFVEKYYNLILLPNCHPEFYYGWISDIQRLMVQHKSLQYSLLACGASHLHFIDSSAQMQELALTYYSEAIKGLSGMLAGASQIENHNGLLMSVILLYLHGCMGRGTYSDTPRHVNAAIRILRLRLMSRSSSISLPFDRLAVESVLYQIFLLTMGSWSDPIDLDYHFDAKFWLQAESLLAQSTLFPGHSISFNSPVLGIPLALFKISLSIKQLHQDPLRRDQETLQQLKSELEEWEGAVLCDRNLDHLLAKEQSNLRNSFYKDAAYLYILIASLLAEQLLKNELSTGPPQAAPTYSWQVLKARQILQRNQNDSEWARCFIGNWPVYTLGFFMSSPGDIRLVRDDIQQRWDLTKFAQISRFQNDLERTWMRRGHAVDDIRSFSTPLAPEN